MIISGEIWNRRGREERKCIYRGKVFTVFTLFVINNLSVYTKPYVFGKGFTTLAVNDLSVYINDDEKTPLAMSLKWIFFIRASQMNA